nr:lantibiotic protection ABC transporter permease subunit, MutE/EpiE family [Streptococcus thermophilus]
MTARVSLGATGYLRAEAIRSCGSVLWWLAVSGLLLGGVLTLFGFAGAIQDATDLLSWQALLVTGMAAPLAALFAGTAENRERDARNGGTAWRPVSPVASRAARLAFVWAALGVFFLLDFGVTAAVASLLGFDRAGVVLLVGIFVWIGALGPAGLAAGLTRRVGLLPTLVVAVVWQIGLGYFVERDWWWLNPGAWPLRLVLPTMGLRFNALPLEPDSPMNGEAPWPALALCLLLAAVGAVCAVLMPVRRARSRRKTVHAFSTPIEAAGPAVARPPKPGSALLGVHHAAATPAVYACLALTGLVMLAAVRYSPDVRQGVFTFLILPVGTGVLPALVWPRLHPAWALMQIEHPRVRSALCTWCVAVVVLVTLVAVLTGTPAAGGLLALLVGTAMVLFALFVTARFGVAWTLALTIIWTIFGVTIGGEVLAETPLWILAPQAWPYTATTPLRFAVAAVLAAALAAGSWATARWQLTGNRSAHR